jgi:hypothetical protein
VGRDADQPVSIAARIGSALADVERHHGGAAGDVEQHDGGTRYDVTAARDPEPDDRRERGTDAEPRSHGEHDIEPRSHECGTDAKPRSDAPRL